jgi:hypothetical protein
MPVWQRIAWVTKWHKHTKFLRKGAKQYKGKKYKISWGWLVANCSYSYISHAILQIAIQQNKKKHESPLNRVLHTLIHVRKPMAFIIIT